MTRQQTLAEHERTAWSRFLTAHARITRRLEQDLLEHHDLTLSDYDVLTQLQRAPGGRLRNHELARALLLTRSGITRVVQRLERRRLVERVPCPDDARGSLVELTAAGQGSLRQAAETHFSGVSALFARPLQRTELETLSALLERLAG